MRCGPVWSARTSTVFQRPLEVSCIALRLCRGLGAILNVIFLHMPNLNKVSDSYSLLWPWQKTNPLQWRHNERVGVSNHQPHDCLLSRLFKCRSKKTSNSASLAFVRGIQRGPVNSPHKGPVTRKMIPFDDVFMRLSLGLSRETAKESTVPPSPCDNTVFSWLW